MLNNIYIQYIHTIYIMQGRKVSKENFWQKNGKAQVCCIEKWYGITELQNFEQLEDAIFYA